MQYFVKKLNILLSDMVHLHKKRKRQMFPQLCYLMSIT